jgi:hypothetical protein
MQPPGLAELRTTNSHLESPVMTPDGGNLLNILVRPSEECKKNLSDFGQLVLIRKPEVSPRYRRVGWGVAVGASLGTRLGWERDWLRADADKAAAPKNKPPNERILELLTEEQARHWREITGDPYCSRQRDRSPRGG